MKSVKYALRTVVALAVVLFLPTIAVLGAGWLMLPLAWLSTWLGLSVGPFLTIIHCLLAAVGGAISVSLGISIALALAPRSVPAVLILLTVGVGVMIYNMWLFWEGVGFPILWALLAGLLTILVASVPGLSLAREAEEEAAAAKL